jgi:glyoxylase-like metal-dependent hydrolase (beta-lactamase superfamily II)
MIVLDRNISLMENCGGGDAGMADSVPKSAAISDDLYIVGFGFVAMYVLAADDRLVAFDTGMRSRALVREFGKLGLDPARVTHVFLAHTDSDHTGGLKAFPNAMAYLSRDELPMVTHSTPRFFKFIYNKPLSTAYEAVADFQELSVGNTHVRCISTPGHTPGSMSYLVNGRMLIVGDILNLDRGRAVMDRAMINMDNGRRRESIQRLARLENISLLCTMHSGYTVDFDAAMAEWRLDSAARG